MNLKKEERLLLAAAIIIIGVIVGYNAFYIAEPSQEIIVYADTESYQQDESYDATINNTKTKVNINTATIEELETLDGIGPTTAQKIINYRENNGDFSSTEDIMQVSGIGEGTYSNIANDITV